MLFWRGGGNESIKDCAEDIGSFKSFFIYNECQTKTFGIEFKLLVQGIVAGSLRGSWGSRSLGIGRDRDKCFGRCSG